MHRPMPNTTNRGPRLRNPSKMVPNSPPPRMQKKMLESSSTYNLHLQQQAQYPSKNMQTSPKNQLISPTKCLVLLRSSLSEHGISKLDEYEFYPNWMNFKSELKFSQYEVEGILSHLVNQSEEMYVEGGDDFKLQIFGLAPIVSKNAQAYMKILSEDFKGADQCLDESNRLINVCLSNPNMEIIPKDYVTGIFYIVKGLKIVVESHMGTLGNNFDFDNFLCHEFEDFSNLSIKSKVVIWASKHFFMKLLKREAREVPYVYKDMIELSYLDPDYYEWKLHLYTSLREQRRSRFGELSCPETAEIQAITSAWNLAPSNPFCMVYLALAAVDSLRTLPNLSEERPMNFGQFLFVSVKTAFDFIKANSMNALRINTKCIRVNIIVANIFGQLLPFKFRDADTARECIFQAYTYGENSSSKANYRLATYMLEDLKTVASTPLMCETQLEKALRLDKRNVQALYCLLQVYLSQPKNSEYKIRMIFSIQRHNVDLTEESQAKLSFLKGCFHFIIGEIENALDCWIITFNILQSELNFKMLRNFSFIYRIFKWPHEKINLPLILWETKNAIEKETNYKRKTILTEILELQQEASDSDSTTNYSTTSTIL